MKSRRILSICIIFAHRIGRRRRRFCYCFYRLTRTRQKRLKKKKNVPRLKYGFSDWKECGLSASLCGGTDNSFGGALSIIIRKTKVNFKQMMVVGVGEERKFILLLDVVL